jgi:hypothetical protein
LAIVKKQVLFCEDNGLYKIGKSKSNVSRHWEINKQSPSEISFIHSFSSSNADKEEMILHKRFSQKRVRGEWFRLDERDVKEILSIREGAL